MFITINLSNNNEVLTMFKSILSVVSSVAISLIPVNVSTTFNSWWQETNFNTAVSMDSSSETNKGNLEKVYRYWSCDLPENKDFSICVETERQISSIQSQIDEKKKFIVSVCGTDYNCRSVLWEHRHQF